MFQIGLLMR